MTAFELTSAAFEQGRPIPPKYTCDGEDISPSLAWRGIPERTVSLERSPTGSLGESLPDAGGIGEGESAPAEDRNDFGSVGWGGPCPPRSHGIHRYVFRLHALEAELGLPAGAAKEEVNEALTRRPLGVAELHRDVCAVGDCGRERALDEASPGISSAFGRRSSRRASLREFGPACIHDFWRILRRA